LALHDVYEQIHPHLVRSALPLAQRDGDKMVLTFDHGTGLKASSDELQGFRYRSSDQKFVWRRRRLMAGR